MGSGNWMEKSELWLQWKRHPRWRFTPACPRPGVFVSDANGLRIPYSRVAVELRAVNIGWESHQVPIGCSALATGRGCRKHASKTGAPNGMMALVDVEI